MSQATTTQVGNGQQSGGIARHKQFSSLLDQMKPRMAAVLPKHITPERMVKMALVAVNRTPKLLECTQTSVAQSLMLAAQLGLDCGGALGSAYLVPFFNKKSGKMECQLIIGYRGMIDLARRSGEIESIAARPVFKGDEFEIEYGSTERLVHRPSPTETPDPAKLIGAYVVAKFKGGGGHIEYMTRVEIERVRLGSQGANGAPWTHHYIEMAKKTAVRRAFKWLPMSTELVDRLQDVAANDAGGGAALAEIIDTTAEEIQEGSADGAQGEPGASEEASAAPAESLGKSAAALAQKLAGGQSEKASATVGARFLQWDAFASAVDQAAQRRGFGPENIDAAMGAWADAYRLKDAKTSGIAQREEFFLRLEKGELDGFKTGDLAAYLMPNPDLFGPQAEPAEPLTRPARRGR